MMASIVTRDDELGDLEDLTPTGRPLPVSRRFAFLAAGSPVPIVAGVVVSAVGFLLIAIAWAKVAGLTDVSKQMPYLVSAGLTGLGLVMVGLLVVNLAVKRQDADERRRQMAQLTSVLRDLQTSVDRDQQS